MIQRIQSIYLFIAVLLFLTGILLNNSNMDLWRWITTVFLAIASIISIWCIFTYKKRMVQVKLVLLSQIAVIFSYLAYLIPYFIGHEAVLDLSIGLFLPVLGFLFNSFARKAILKDEKLVRAADRIR